MPRGIYVRTEYHRLINSRAKTGVKQSKETIENRVRKNTGQKRSAEVRHRMSLAQKGRIITEEARKKISKSVSISLMGNKRCLGHKPSLETRKKLSEALKGEKCFWWDGGKTAVNSLVRRSLEYRLWREAVFKRDNWTCQECKKRGSTMHAHHIKPFYLFPELRLSIDNGMTLCIECHIKTDTYKRPKREKTCQK